MCSSHPTGQDGMGYSPDGWTEGPGLPQSMWRYKWLVGGLALLGILIAALLSAIQPTQYEGVVPIFVSAEEGSAGDPERTVRATPSSSNRRSCWIVSSPLPGIGSLPRIWKSSSRSSPQQPGTSSRYVPAMQLLSTPPSSLTPLTSRTDRSSASRGRRPLTKRSKCLSRSRPPSERDRADPEAAENCRYPDLGFNGAGQETGNGRHRKQDRGDVG